MRKFWLYLGYYTFALILPLVFINEKFPFSDFFEGNSTVYKLSLGALIAIPFIFLFFRKKFVEWVKSFDRIGWFKGINMWILYISPVTVAFLLVALTANYTAQFTFILGWSTLSYMIAGVFNVLLKKAKVDKFKKWVNE